ncbi:hypothetical protein P7C73_g6043, partial [Tremellales sp. Uapishka_1]
MPPPPDSLLRLPVECLNMVIDRIPDDPSYLSPTLRSLRLTCRLFDKILSPRVYRDIGICSPSGLQSFVATLEASPPARYHAPVEPSLEERRRLLVESVQTLFIFFDSRNRSTLKGDVETRLPNLIAIQICTVSKSFDHELLFNWLSRIDCDLRHFRWDSPPPLHLVQDLEVLLWTHQNLVSIDIPGIDGILQYLPLAKLRMLRVSRGLDMSSFPVHLFEEKKSRPGRYDPDVELQIRLQNDAGDCQREWVDSLTLWPKDGVAIFRENRQAAQTSARDWVRWVCRHGWTEEEGCRRIVWEHDGVDWYTNNWDSRE